MSPWLTLLATLGPGILQMLLGGGKTPTTQQKQVTEQTIKQDPKGYQSPLLGLMDPLFADTMLSQVQGRAGGGMPGGKSNLSPQFADILALIRKELPLIMESYGKGGKGKNVPLNRTTATVGG